MTVRDVADVVVVGGGVVGLSIASVLHGRHPDARIVVIDKEDGPGRHASGRNSGVLHAGFYYTADSLKARLCRDGCAAWKAWCRERGIRVAETGKLVVAPRPDLEPLLDALAERARANGVVVQRVTAGEAREIEPRIRCTGSALWSPTTASVVPGEVMAALAREVAVGVDVRWGTCFRGWDGEGIRTDRGRIVAGRVVNAAGLHADRVAAAFGAGGRVRLVPFRGAYLEGGAPPGHFRVQIYPVPDLAMPFLGVHTTVDPAGAVRLGPTATPALWREQYGGLAGFVPGDLLEVAAAQVGLAVADPRFRAHALAEIRKLRRRRVVALAGRLADLPRSGWRWGRPGIRAQLVDRRTGTLVDDLVIEEAPRSVHVLNAVSPAFTCAWPFARLVADRVTSAG